MKSGLNVIVTLLVLVSTSGYSQTNKEDRQESNSKQQQSNSGLLHGRWHLVEIKIELDDSDGLGDKAEEAFIRSSESQKKVKQQIINREIAIITQFNYDGTFTHEIVYADPKIRFPSYKESGSWTLNELTGELSRKALDQDITTLEFSEVKTLNKNELVLVQRYTDKEYDGVYKGFVETLYLKRFNELNASN